MILPALAPPLHRHLEDSLPRLVSLLRSEFSAVRHMASVCIAEMAGVVTVPTMVAIVNDVS